MLQVTQVRETGDVTITMDNDDVQRLIDVLDSLPNVKYPLSILFTRLYDLGYRPSRSSKSE